MAFADEMMLKHKAEIDARIAALRADLEKKRLAAIDALADTWVNHLDYEFTPRHSNDIAVWYPHATLNREHIRRTAALCRRDNPAWQRNQKFLSGLTN